MFLCFKDLILSSGGDTGRNESEESGKWNIFRKLETGGTTAEKKGCCNSSPRKRTRRIKGGRRKNIETDLPRSIPALLDVEVPLPLQVDVLVIVNHPGPDQISAK